GWLRSHHARCRTCVCREFGRMACHAPCQVAHHDNKLRAIVRGGRCGRGIAGRGRPTDSRAVLLPLVTEQRRACCHHIECGRLPYRHRLVGRLRSDCGRHLPRTHRERGGLANHAPRRIPHHYIERSAVIGSLNGWCRVARCSCSFNGLAILL